MNLVEAVQSAGVVGAGGAGFPTHAKIGASVDCVLANGAECEPLLHSDQFIILERANEVVDGLKSVMQNTGAKTGVICIKEKNLAGAKALEPLLQKNISLLKLKDFYPAGDEQILTYEATGRITPEGGIPLEVGVLVQNVATLANIARAEKGEAVTTKTVTVGGEIKNPGIHQIPIGTSLADVISVCGGSLIEDYVALLNGPMMGRLVDPSNEVVTKTTSGLFLLPRDNPLATRFLRQLPADIRLSRGACEQCRYCTDFCPRYLQGHSLKPHMIMRVMNEQREPEVATVTDSFLCCECGVCDLFACPLALSPRRFFREFKSTLSKRGIRYAKKAKAYEADVYREFRRVPKDKLLRRIGVSQYNVAPEFHGKLWDVDSVEIPLSMHIGSASEAVVSVGDKVKRGQLVGKIPDGKLGASVHASIAGTVTKVNVRVRIERRS
ncbi:MAG: SLBB domain-containing protein [Nitrospinae bacterium]|nr:SLBB domain-containing protein [Nitrospinota bacterium]